MTKIIAPVGAIEQTAAGKAKITIPAGGGGSASSGLGLTSWSVPSEGYVDVPGMQSLVTPKLVCRGTATISATFNVTLSQAVYFRSFKNGVEQQVITVSATGTVTPTNISVVAGDMVWYLMDGGGATGKVNSGTVSISASTMDIPTWTLDATVSPSGGSAAWITPEITVAGPGFATAIFNCDSSGGGYYSYLYLNGGSVQTITVSGAANYAFASIKVVRGDRLQIKYQSGGGGHYFSGGFIITSADAAYPLPRGRAPMTPTVRAAAGVPSGLPTGTELPIAADTTATTGGLYFWTGAAWTKIATIP